MTTVDCITSEPADVSELAGSVVECIVWDCLSLNKAYFGKVNIEFLRVI